MRPTPPTPPEPDAGTDPAGSRSTSIDLERFGAVLAECVLERWPEATVLTAGRVTLPFVGFGCDFELSCRPTPGDLERLSVALCRRLGLPPLGAGSALEWRAGSGPRVWLLPDVDETAARGAAPRHALRAVAGEDPVELACRIARLDRGLEHHHLRSARRMGLVLPAGEAPGSFDWLPDGLLVHHLLCEAIRHLVEPAIRAEDSSASPVAPERELSLRTELHTGPWRRRAGLRDSARRTLAETVSRVAPDRVVPEVARSISVAAELHHALGARLVARLSDSEPGWGWRVQREIKERSRGRPPPEVLVVEAPNGPRVDLFTPNVFGALEHPAGSVVIEPSPSGAGTIPVRAAPLASIESGIATALEAAGGRLPLWLVPAQVLVIGVAAAHAEAARAVHERLVAEGFRSRLDLRAIKLLTRLRDARRFEIPWIAMIGPRELGSSRVGLRPGSAEHEEREVDIEDLVALLRQERKPPGETSPPESC